jgi:SAM-dependent methyltransferase
LPASCVICGPGAVTEVTVPYPSFQHLDFSVIHPGPVRLGLCGRCGLLTKIGNPDEFAAIDAMFVSKEYAAHQEIHALVVDEYPHPVSLPFLQARLLEPELTKAEASVLDIGSFDGTLLSELAEGRTVADFAGYDVAPRAGFPVRAGFRSLHGPLGAVEGRFNLAVLSHSMQYVRDLKSLVEFVGARLLPNGKLFVQVPNAAAKPCSLLLGDQYHHFLEDSLANVFAVAGFAHRFLHSRWFPRDILALSWPDAAIVRHVKPVRGSIGAALERVDALATALDALPPPAGRLGVLGTTIEGAFAATRLGDRLAYFVDENPHKIGTLFHGRPVIHPAETGSADMVVLPMGASGEKLRQRLAAAHPATFVSA